MIGTFPRVQSVASEHLWGSVSPCITPL